VDSARNGSREAIFSIKSKEPPSSDTSYLPRATSGLPCFNTASFWLTATFCRPNCLSQFRFNELTRHLRLISLASGER